MKLTGEVKDHNKGLLTIYQVWNDFIFRKCYQKHMPEKCLCRLRDGVYAFHTRPEVATSDLNSREVKNRMKNSEFDQLIINSRLLDDLELWYKNS